MIDVNEIKKRADELEEIKVKLKEIFVGLDDIIDEFINNIKVWYILPDVQTRPLIVNLWGMTGIGKTDLVRKFVKFAGFNDRFITLSIIPHTWSHTNLESKKNGSVVNLEFDVLGKYVAKILGKDTESKISEEWFRNLGY